MKKIYNLYLWIIGVNFIVLPFTILKYGFDFWKLFIHIIFMVIPITYCVYIDLKKEK
jgi:hypothetical protein